MVRLLVLVILVLVVQCQMLVEDMPEETTDEEDREGHIAVIRPDYSLWRMVKVLKNMFESRTEKRRQRDLDVVASPAMADSQWSRPLRARRLLFNF